MAKQIVVIGGGIAGMAAACRLAKRGHDVHLFEKNDRLGGKIASVSQDGFYWDSGPSFFTDEKELRRLFRFCGRDLEDYIEIEHLDEACRYFFADGRVLRGYDSPKELAEEFQNVLGEPEKNIRAYLRRAKQIYEGVGSQFLDAPFSIESLKNPRNAASVSTLPLSLLYSSLHTENKRAFRTKEAQMFFDRFATYNGSDPYQTPGMMSCLPHLEHNIGAMYVVGGMRSLVEGVYRLLEEQGVTIHTNTSIEKITYSQNEVTGIITNSGWVPADSIVSALDIQFLYEKLLPVSKKTMKQYVKKERSSSAMVFCLGMSRRHPELYLHNIFFSADYRQESRELWREKEPAREPTVYINVTSTRTPKHAPTASENWFVMLKVPARLHRENHINLIRKRALANISKHLGYDVSSSIVSEIQLSPLHFDTTYNAREGAIYGAASNSFRSAFLRHPNKSPDYKNLYTVGVSTHPGGGIPLALRSARIVDILIRDEK